MKKINLGINTCFTATRWPLPDEKFRLIREEFGLDIVQYSLDGFDGKLSPQYKKRLCESIREAATRYGISIHSTLTGASHHHDSLLFHPDSEWRENSLNWFKEAISFSSAIGAKGTGGFYGALSMAETGSGMRQTRISDFINCLAVLSKAAKKRGLEFIMLEPMSVRREPPSTVEETLFVLREANRKTVVPVRLCLDVGHHLAVSADSEEEKDPCHWISVLAGFSSVIHVHQTDTLSSRHWPFTECYNRRGIIRAEKVIEAIESSGVEEAMLMIEIFRPPFEPMDDQILEEIKISVDYWKNALKNAKIHRAVADE